MSLHTSNLATLITPTFIVGVFVCLVERKVIDSIIRDNTFLSNEQGSTHRHMNAIRQALRQYTELCLNVVTLTEIGLQVPIKTIRQ